MFEFNGRTSQKAKRKMQKAKVRLKKQVKTESAKSQILLSLCARLKRSGPLGLRASFVVCRILLILSAVPSPFLSALALSLRVLLGLSFGRSH